jgi:hypothetical protein
LDTIFVDADSILTKLAASDIAFAPFMRGLDKFRHVIAFLNQNSDSFSFLVATSDITSFRALLHVTLAPMSSNCQATGVDLDSRVRVVESPPQAPFVLAFHAT